MKVPTPKELLEILQKIDPTIFMSTVPVLGIAVYGSLKNTYGFTVGIDPETLNLSVKVSNQNIFVQNEESEPLPLPEFLDWFRDGVERWAAIPVEGRTGPRETMTAYEELELEQEPEFEISKQVQDIMDKRVTNVIEI